MFAKKILNIKYSLSFCCEHIIKLYCYSDISLILVSNHFMQQQHCRLPHFTIYTLLKNIYFHNEQQMNIRYSFVLCDYIAMADNQFLNERLTNKHS